MGSCDGTFRRKRYFSCKDGYGIFVTAFNLNITSRAQANTMERRSVILSSDKSQTGRTFYEDDEVAVYSAGGKRVTGRAKWAYPLLDKDRQRYHVIGIETDVRTYVVNVSVEYVYVPCIKLVKCIQTLPLFFREDYTLRWLVADLPC